jgi:hypothetical protein
VTSYDYRPIKIEGNRSIRSTWGDHRPDAGEHFDLYDPDRVSGVATAKSPPGKISLGRRNIWRLKYKVADWDLSEATSSPSVRAMKKRLQSQQVFPSAKV